MTDVQDWLSEARALLAQGTRGKWMEGEAGNRGILGWCNLVDYDGDDIVGVAHVPSPPKLALIVLAHNALPALLDVVEAARVLDKDRQDDGLSADDYDAAWDKLNAALARLDALKLERESHGNLE